MFNIVGRIREIVVAIRRIDSRLDILQTAIGRVESRQLNDSKIQELVDSEFKVFSQWGEDGIIQYLIRMIPIENKTLIEFGVENYLESNTRFLVVNNNWSGLVLDSSEKNISFIEKDPISWKHSLVAERAFITAENINEIIKKSGLTGDIGLLSIDIDGNDYWVWKAINIVSPRIVVVEYNNFFGSLRKITIPYDSKFSREIAHSSNLYYGASLAALNDLAEDKGYSLVGSNSAGSNAFFVRNDVLSGLKKVSPSEVYFQSKCRESRDSKGNLTYLDIRQALSLIGEMPVFNLDSQKIVRIIDLNL